MRVTRSKAIRLKCIDCMCGQLNEVKLCPCKNCPLWNYRLGYEVDDEGNYTPKRKGNKNAFQNGSFEVEIDD